MLRCSNSAVSRPVARTSLRGRIRRARRVCSANAGPRRLDLLAADDAKFPVEDYDRLLAAVEVGDAVALESAGKALERSIKVQARMIREKYVESPHTTDFAIMFLPTEGLFAEVLRRPGLADHLHRECRTVVAGPTTLFAMLNSLQMGFRTLALEQRSAEVWQVLGAVKTEFGKFGEVLATLHRQLLTASDTIDSAQRRSMQMTKR